MGTSSRGCPFHHKHIKRRRKCHSKHSVDYFHLYLYGGNAVYRLLRLQTDVKSDGLYARGRSLGPAVTALSAGAADMSGWLLMGLPGAMFSTGLSGAWIVIGLVLGAWANWLFVAPRLRTYTEKAGNSLPFRVSLKIVLRSHEASQAVFGSCHSRFSHFTYHPAWYPEASYSKAF